jgi:hypothetical protein
MYNDFRAMRSLAFLASIGSRKWDCKDLSPRAMAIECIETWSTVGVAPQAMEAFISGSMISTRVVNDRGFLHSLSNVTNVVTGPGVFIERPLICILFSSGLSGTALGRCRRICTSRSSPMSALNKGRPNPSFVVSELQAGGVGRTDKMTDSRILFENTNDGIQNHTTRGEVPYRLVGSSSMAAVLLSPLPLIMTVPKTVLMHENAFEVVPPLTSQCNTGVPASSRAGKSG